MRVIYALVALICAVPALIVAVALGPVIIGILCAVGCALLVALLVNFVLGLGMAGRSAVRHAHHTTPPRPRA